MIKSKFGDVEHQASTQILNETQGRFVDPVDLTEDGKLILDKFSIFAKGCLIFSIYLGISEVEQQSSTLAFSKTQRGHNPTMDLTEDGKLFY